MIHCREYRSLLAVHLNIGTIALLGLHMVYIGRSIALQAAEQLTMHSHLASEHLDPVLTAPLFTPYAAELPCAVQAGRRRVWQLWAEGRGQPYPETMSAGRDSRIAKAGHIKGGMGLQGQGY